MCRKKKSSEFNADFTIQVINVCGILINQCCVRRCGCFNQGSKLKFGSFTIGLDLDNSNTG